MLTCCGMAMFTQLLQIWFYKSIVRTLLFFATFSCKRLWPRRQKKINGFKLNNWRILVLISLLFCSIRVCFIAHHIASSIWRSCVAHIQRLSNKFQKKIDRNACRCCSKKRRLLLRKCTRLCLCGETWRKHTLTHRSIKQIKMYEKWHVKDVYKHATKKEHTVTHQNYGTIKWWMCQVIRVGMLLWATRQKIISK